jgi:hypothetical protein
MPDYSGLFVLIVMFAFGIYLAVDYAIIANKHTEPR